MACTQRRLWAHSDRLTGVTDRFAARASEVG